MTLYSQHVKKLWTPQGEVALEGQVQNNAGGFVFEMDKWKQLDRFLILGSEGGHYYASEKRLTKGCAKNVEACIKEDGLRAVARIAEISDSGRAPKNDPAIFALSLAAASVNIDTRRAALAALPQVCRIGTHLFHFAQDVTQNRGWSRALRTAVARWYTERGVDSLALQAVKYQQRDGWSHRDMLRLSHAKPPSKEHNAIFRHITGNAEAHQGRKDCGVTELPALIQAVVEANAVGTEPRRVEALIREFGLPHECVPNELKSRADIWAAMLPSMGITAIIRNLGKMTEVGLLKPMSQAVSDVVASLTNESTLRRGRVHPIQLLTALKIYKQGHGLKGSLSWTPEREIVDALDEAFYLSFSHQEPTNKRILLALDVSGSMDGARVAGSPLTAREFVGAVAMSIAKVEKKWHAIGFSHRLVDIDISPKMRLDDVLKKMRDIPMGATDCALPMIEAAQIELDVDAFVTMTDNETWAGDVHPFQALRHYRSRRVNDAKMIVFGTTATEFSIAPQDDAGCLDIVGADASAPAIMSEFIRGGI